MLAGRLGAGMLLMLLMYCCTSVARHSNTTCRSESTAAVHPRGQSPARRLRVRHRTSTALQVGLDGRAAHQAHPSRRHICGGGQLIMLCTNASLHAPCEWHGLHKFRLSQPSSPGAPVLGVHGTFSTEGLLGSRHHQCNINRLALQHVRRPVWVGAHKLQGSAQHGRPRVGAAAAQARSNVDHEGAAKEAARAEPSQLTPSAQRH
jgi:hypothetical protein